MYLLSKEQRQNEFENGFLRLLFDTLQETQVNMLILSGKYLLHPYSNITALMSELKKSFRISNEYVFIFV